MCINTVTEESVHSTKLNRNCEGMPSGRTNDYIDDNEYALLKNLAEKTDVPVDMIFSPVANFHTYHYIPINKRWG